MLTYQKGNKMIIYAKIIKSTKYYDYVLVWSASPWGGDITTELMRVNKNTKDPYRFQYI